MLTALQPLTSIWVSSIDHFLRGFFSWEEEATSESSRSVGVDILRILPLFSGTRAEVSGTWDSTPVSSRKSHAGTRRGDEARARETRRCFTADIDGVEEEGRGAVNEKVEEEDIAVRVRT